MNKILSLAVAFALLSLPLQIYAQSEQSSAAPPVSQNLVPEGDFAVQLATALKLGKPANEAQAEDMLTSAGIAPKNGWIADYPVTPNVVGELQSAIESAADSKKLSMGRDEAMKAFQGVTTDLGLAITPAPGQYAETQAPTSSEYVEPQVINNYYYEEGPPVVSYYPPPWDYYYLYAWVPFPFFFTGFFFPGFFVLHDFHRHIFFGHRDVLISNHFFDHVHNRFFVVDPIRHSFVSPSHIGAFHSGGFSSPTARSAASSIFQRSEGRREFGQEGSGRMGFGRTEGNHGFVGNDRGGFRSDNRSGAFSGAHSFSGFSGSHTAGGGFSGNHMGGFSGSHTAGGGFSGNHMGGFSGGHSFGGGFHGGGGGFHGGGGHR